MMLKSTDPEKTLELISDTSKFKIQSKDVKDYCHNFHSSSESKIKPKDDEEVILGKRSENKSKEHLEYIEYYKTKILKVENIK